jgi:hypothetical protein
MKLTFKEVLGVLLFGIVIWAVSFGLVKFWTNQVSGNLVAVQKVTLQEACQNAQGDYKMSTWTDSKGNIQPAFACFMYK